MEEAERIELPDKRKRVQSGERVLSGERDTS
jgi:hypothetical protein